MILNRPYEVTPPMMDIEYRTEQLTLFDEPRIDPETLKANIAEVRRFLRGDLPDGHPALVRPGVRSVA